MVHSSDHSTFTLYTLYGKKPEPYDRHASPVPRDIFIHGLSLVLFDFRFLSDARARLYMYAYSSLPLTLLLCIFEMSLSVVRCPTATGQAETQAQKSD